MKNRKWLLAIILFLIICVLAFMVFVMATGSGMYKEEQSYFLTLSEAGCNYVQDSNVTKNIWNNNPEWQKIYISTLIEKNYVKEDSTNPVTNEKARDNKKGYIKIEFEGNRYNCSYKED